MWGVIRDDKGIWINGLSKNMGSYNAIFAEFWEVFEGLKIIKSLSLRKMVVNVYSIVVVNAIEEGKICLVECE